MAGIGYWLKAETRIDISIKTHLQTVMENPGDFGISEVEIQEAFEECDELIGTELRARRVILSKVYRNSWVRAKNQFTHWEIEFSKWDATTRDTVDTFISWAMDEVKCMKQSDSVIMSGVDDCYLRVLGGPEGGAVGFFGGSTPRTPKKLTTNGSEILRDS